MAFRGIIAAFLLAFAPDAAPLARGAAMPPIVRPPQDEVIYQIMPIAWRDSNLDAVGSVQARFGDFGGLSSAESLDYLSYLGVTMVYLQPVFPSNAYHGYQHGVPDTLNPAFGTEAQYLAFVQAAHARGIKVIMDFVAYGVSHNSPYFQSAWQNPASPYDSWLAFTNAANSTYVGYTYGTWNGAPVGFIHWNLDNPAVVAQLVAWARKWLDPNGDGDPSDGVDGFRLDHAWASGGEGWGADIDFWKTWCSALREVRSDVFIFCEQSDWGNYGADLLVPDAFDAVMTKPWEFAARDAVNLRNASGLYSAMAATVAAVPNGKTAVAQTNDHDSDRLASIFLSSNARQKVAAAILFTQPFPPNIYYGDEIGMKGVKANVGSDANDIPMREPFKWKAVAGAPMTNYPAVTVGTLPPTYSANNDGRSVEEQRGVAGSLLETHRALIAVRKASPALRRGSYLPVTCPNSGVYAFVRHEASETVLVAINLNSGSTTTTLDLGAFTVPAAGTVPTSLENGSTLAAITAANKSSYPITLAARSWFIARAALTPPVDTSHADIDGRSLAADAGASALRATQSCLSSFGDNAGELNQLFVRADGDALRVSLSGNLPTDGTSLDLFIDVDPGAGTGQNTLATAHLPSPPGGLAPLDGTRFDAGFSPDALYYMNAVGSSVYADRVSLPSGAKLATTRYLGSTGLNSGRGVLAGGTNPNQVEIAFDNTNTLGITASSTAGAASATTGFELRIPFADLGLAADFRGSIALTAFLQRNSGAVSNQWLPSLPAGSGDLGLAPNLATAAGTQHVVVSIGLVGDIDGDGGVGGADLAVLLSNWGPRTSAAASIASDLDGSGTIDAGDLALLLSAWGQG
ncbi:MAG: alpha-glucosidase C-terminal domain-containing protein [Planctomycetaceae bacterium]|nr:alpha-glucosidase C-terminal domain-containing protein [Planctomycetaceae bacterium]